MLEKLNLCNGKKLWLEVENIKDKTVEYENDLSNAKKTLAQRQKVYDDVIKQQGVITTAAVKLSGDVEKNVRKEIF